jgi:hypothetical protein
MEPDGGRVRSACLSFECAGHWQFERSQNGKMHASKKTVYWQRTCSLAFVASLTVSAGADAKVVQRTATAPKS